MAQLQNTAELFSTLAQALQKELESLSKSRQEITLFGGAYRGSFANEYYYRFEVPEEVYFRGVEHATFVFSQLQPVTIAGTIISFDNQFLTVALPMDFGTILPEIQCSWSHEEYLKPVLDLLATYADNHPVAPSLFQPAQEANRHSAGFEPAFLPTTPANQQEAVKNILHNRVSFLWGPILSGKIHVLALIASNYVKAGKKVLFVANNNDRVDETVLCTTEVGKALGIDVQNTISRVGLPLRLDAESLGPFSLEYEVGAKKSEKKKSNNERVSLLQTYWKTKVHQFLHEDFYSKLTELRERANENRKQFDKLTDEINTLKDTLSRAQNTSMLEKFKKGFSKEEAAVAQKQLTKKQAALKKIQAVQQAFTTELMRAEAQTPIDSNELNEYQDAVKRIGVLGGVKKVMEDVEAYTAVDERALLASKKFVATTVATALADPRLRGMQFDMVIVDDAETVQMPSLAALSLLAQEKMLVAGDPYQLGPESHSNNALVQDWLRSDIFLHVAQTEQLNKLFDWSQQHSQGAIFLSSHFATTPKLSLFVASILFDDKINVFAPPHAKGKIYFIDTGSLNSACRQYVGKKRIIPHNDLQTKKVVELVKHALMERNRSGDDVGVVLPFNVSTFYTKLQLRLSGIRNVEVGTPQSFRGRRKKAIIFDTVMAGVDYTVKHLDDRKTGEHKIARLLNSIFSCVEEDLYVVADMSHFTSVYKDRLFTKLLMLLQAQADPQPPSHEAARRFDDLEWDQRAKLFNAFGSASAKPVVFAQSPTAKESDAEFDVKMKMMSKQLAPKSIPGVRNFERETYIAVQRVLGQRKDVNILSQFIGGDVLFRHSLGTEQAAARLPIDACQNEDEFRKIMERWNLIIYEMSGGSKTDVSFFGKAAPETRVRWDINNLKAYYSTSAEAVIEEGKHKIAASVSKVFQECLGKSQPANPTEWSTAYLNFLGKMETYLAWISEQLRK